MSELQKTQTFQFSIRAIFIAIGISGILLSLAIPVFKAASIVGWYFVPDYLFGNALLPIVGTMLLISPVLLIATLALLWKYPPQPISIFVFFLFFVLAIIQLFSARPNIEALYTFSKVMSFILVTVAVISLAEVSARRLRVHYFSSATILIISLTYWFLTSGFVSSV